MYTCCKCCVDNLTRDVHCKACTHKACGKCQYSGHNPYARNGPDLQNHKVDPPEKKGSNKKVID